jgi:hypothetical protein
MVLKPFRLLYGLLKDSWSFGKAEHEILVKRNEVYDDDGWHSSVFLSINFSCILCAYGKTQTMHSK